MFHLKCGNRIKLSNENRTATRNASEFNFGLVFSAEPLTDNELFQFRIDKKIYSWTGGLEVGVTTCDPENITVPPSAVDLKTETWLLAGKTVIKDGKTIVENYPLNLDKLNEGDKLAILRTADGELELLLNGTTCGVAATGVPPSVFAVIDVYGKVSQVTVSPSPYWDGDEGACSVSIESGSSLELPLDTCCPTPPPHSYTPPQPPPERMRFHHCTGALVKLSSSGRSAERLRPMDEFNNAVVMTHRPLMPDSLFEIRIDRLVDKWSGSIEVGVTCHDPSSLKFPATMTNMRSGTVMMSGCGILTNGRGSKRQYGQYNLDQLRVGDRIGMMRKSNGDLHYYINGMDQGIAANNVPLVVWAVADLYGMTVKVTIVDRDEREEQNLITRRNASLRDNNSIIIDGGEDDGEDELKFHPNCGSHAAVINNGLTALRPNAMDDFNNAVVLSNRPLRLNEVFEVRLDKTISKWTGSIEIGVTTHGPTELEHPSTMTNIRSGTWIMTGSAVMHNGQSVIDDYGVNLDRLGAGDRVGVVLRDRGSLHFLVNGVDQGEAGTGLPPGLFAVVDLYGQASQSSIVPQCPTCTPTTPHLLLPQAPLPTDIHFHSLHGRNARVSNGGRTASRPRAMTEFNDAIVITNRALAPGEMFSVMVERIVDRWTGSIEAGVTAISPSELELPGTMTDLDHDTWMLSGFAVMKDGVTLTQGYRLDLDKASQGSVIGIKRHDNATLHYYLDGVDMGEACGGIPQRVYPCIDLYGRCAQVSILNGDGGTMPGPSHQEDCGQSLQDCSLTAGQAQPHSRSETTVTVSAPDSNPHHYLHKLVSWPREGNEEATELRSGCLGMTSTPLAQGQALEFILTGVHLSHQASCLSIGITTASSLPDPPPLSLAAFPSITFYIQGCDVYKTGGEIHKAGFCSSLDWLRPGNHVSLKRGYDSTVRLYLNSVDQGVMAHSLPRRVYGIVHVQGSTSGICVISRAWQGEAPLASLDADSPSDKRVECEGYNEKGGEDMEKSIEDGELLSEVHEADEEGSEEIGGTEQHVVPCCSVTSPAEQAVAPLFHELHGRNIQLSCGRLAAKRVASYNQGLVLASQPLSKSHPLFQVRIESMNCRWNSSLCVGVASQCTLTGGTSLPVTSLHLKRDAWMVGGDTLYHNSHIVRRLNIDLDMLSVGSVVGLCLDQELNLMLLVNGIQLTLCTLPPGKSYLPVIDLYGMCHQVSVVGGGSSRNGSGEDWPCCPRMSSSWDVTTSLMGSRSKTDKMNENIQHSLSNQSAAHRGGGWSSSVGELSRSTYCHPVPPRPSISSHSQPSSTPVNRCPLLSASIALRDSLLLPCCLLSGEAECLCCKCSGALGCSGDKMQCSGDADRLTKGWTKHPLRQAIPAPQTKWHKAWSRGLPVWSIRPVLDARRLLTPKELCLCRGYGRSGRDSKTEDDPTENIVLYPCLTSRSTVSTEFRHGDIEYRAMAVFELRVRPGSYRVRESASTATLQQQTAAEEWITGEKNSAALVALMLHLHPA